MEEWSSAVVQAAALWSPPSVACTSLRIEVAPPSGKRFAVEDGVNLLAFRRQMWCHNDSCGSGETFPGPTVAMTTTYPAGVAGREIREADVELNAIRFRFFTGTVPESVAAPASLRDAPLVPVLVHELGHVIGLEDACGSHATSGAPYFDSCTDEMRDSVMFAPALLTKPTTRDLEMLCSLYPATDIGGSSRVARTPTNEHSLTLLWLSVLALVAAAAILTAWARRRLTLRAKGEG